MIGQPTRKACRALLGLALGGVLLTGPAVAEIYRWVDENGETHFSERAPSPGEEASQLEAVSVDTGVARQQVTVPPPKQKDVRELPLTPEQRAAYDKRNAELTQAHAERCKEAGAAIAQLSTTPRLFYLDDDGNRVVMPEEMRQARLDEARKAKQESCSFKPEPLPTP